MKGGWRRDRSERAGTSGSAICAICTEKGDAELKDVSMATSVFMHHVFGRFAFARKGLPVRGEITRATRVREYGKQAAGKSVERVSSPPDCVSHLLIAHVVALRSGRAWTLPRA